MERASDRGAAGGSAARRGGGGMSAGVDRSLSGGGSGRSIVAVQGLQGHRGDGAMRRGDEAVPDPVRGAAVSVSPAPRVDADADLVEALRREDPDAAERLVERYGDRVYRLAMRITGLKEDAEEAAQDALWTIARKVNMFKGESAFGSWIYRITANAAYQKLRTRRQKSAEIAMDDVMPALDGD